MICINTEFSVYIHVNFVRSIYHDAVKGFVKIRKKVSHGRETRGKKQKFVYVQFSTIKAFDAITYARSGYPYQD